MKERLRIPQFGETMLDLENESYNEIMKGHVRVILIAALLSGSFLLSRTASAEVSFDTNLRLGAEGVAVSALQECLTSAGYFHHSLTPYFGSVTLAALTQWQAEHNIPATGFFGPLSRADANAGLCESVASTTDPASVASSTDPAPQSGITIRDGKLYWLATGLPVQIEDTGSDVNGFASTQPAISISIDPAIATSFEDAITSFVATVSNSENKAVTWSASGGSVSTSGVYTAPFVTATTTYTVTATAQDDSTKFASASVTVVPVVVNVSPASTTLTENATTTFSALVTNATTTAVTWSATGGSIDTNGIFTAPGVLATTTYTITASSTVDANDAGTATVTVTPGSGPIDQWLLDTNDGTTASDTPNSANNGTWHGTQVGTQGYYTVGWNSNLIGDFDGSTDYVSTPAMYSFSPSTSFTWSVWVFVNSGNNQDVVILGDRHTSDWIKLTPSAFEYGGGSIVSHNIPTGSWEFITVTDSAGNFVYYQNGLVEGTGTDNTDSFSNIPFSIGTDPVGESDGLFKGQLGDVRVYNRALSAEEIEAIYDATKASS